jgi:D-glycero-D-manno-heptose 1,7-bisphosphate phosphatase
VSGALRANLRRAVFLDRDGVLNRAPVVDGVPLSPQAVAELEILPGVLEATLQLSAEGWCLVVVTNQPDIARGRITRPQVEAINQALAAKLPLADVRLCPHDDADRCDCRKPAPGMLLAAARDHGIDLPGSVMVGDRWRDIEAGRRAGTRTVHVLGQGYAEPAPAHADLTVASLLDAVPWISALARPAGREARA